MATKTKSNFVDDSVITNFQKPRKRAKPAAILTTRELLARPRIRKALKAVVEAIEAAIKAGEL